MENNKRQSGSQAHQLEELKHIGLLTGCIIHRINNTFGVIRGFTDIVLRNMSVEDQSYNYLKKILQEVDLANGAIERMRVFAGQKKSNPELINIQPVVEKTVKEFQESLTFPVNIQQDIGSIHAKLLLDTDHIQKMIVNLCSNACDAIGENEGTLKITLKEINVGASEEEEYIFLKEGGYIKLTVSDTGKGMDKKTTRQIYEPFFSTKEKSKHTGLGLSIVHEIVKSYQGVIKVESNLGMGTTFDIYLPIEDKNIN